MRRRLQAPPAALMRRRLFLAALLAFATLPLIATAEERHFDLALKAGALPKNLQTIKVKQGDSVELKWTSDQPIKMHLHGYDMEIAVKPGMVLISLMIGVPSVVRKKSTRDSPSQPSAANPSTAA